MEDRYRKAASAKTTEGKKPRRARKRSVSRSTIGLSEGGWSTPSYLKSDREVSPPKSREPRGSKVEGVSVLGSSSPPRGLGQIELPKDDESD